MVRHRISARVLPTFYNKFSAAMKVLGLTQQDLIVQALETEFTRVNLRKQCQLLTNANAALTVKQEHLTSERDELRQSVKQIASKLGVSETVGACLQEIVELEQELATTGDKLSVVVGDRDALREKRDGYKESRDSYKASRDRFKAKYEGSVSDLAAVRAKLAAYQRQGVWGRLFRRIPVVVPCVEPE